MKYGLGRLLLKGTKKKSPFRIHTPGLEEVWFAAVLWLVYCFYRFMRKPAEGKWLPVIMVYWI